MERLYAGILEHWSSKVYRSTRPWKCIDFNSHDVFLKTVLVENQLYMKRLYVGISEHWFFGSVSEYWTFGSVSILIALIYLKTVCRESIYMERLYAGIFGALVLWKCIGAQDLCKCIDSNSPAMF